MSQLIKADPRLSDPRLIVALDEPTLDGARDLAKRLGDQVSFFKIGLTLMAQGGLKLAYELRDQGKMVFQDWKLHDIGAQVEGAARAASLGACDFLTVHAEPQVMRAAVKGRGSSGTKLLGVTVMTTLTDADLLEMGYTDKALDLVLKRVDQAMDCGMDGVVASPLEAKIIRARVPADFLIVTPGVRPTWAAANDQQRIATPEQALGDGASHLVVGRPITAAADPIEAAQKILAAIA